MAPGYYKGLKWNIFRSSSSFTRTDKTWWVCRALGLAFVWKLRDASKAASSPLPEPPPTPLTAAALQRHEERVLERDKCNKTMFREFEDSMFHCLMNRTCFKLQWDCEASVEGSHATIARWFFPGCNGATQPKMVSVCYSPFEQRNIETESFGITTVASLSTNRKVEEEGQGTDQKFLLHLDLGSHLFLAFVSALEKLPKASKTQARLIDSMIWTEDNM